MEEATEIAAVEVTFCAIELKLINAAMKSFNQTDLVQYVKNATLRFAADELSLAQNVPSQEEQFDYV